MTPNSELNLKTNRDASQKVIYTVESSQDFSCLESGTNCAQGKNSNSVVTVDSTGIVRSYETLGLAIILAHVREESGIMQTIIAKIEVSLLKMVKFQIMCNVLCLNY
jgi:hypothetical protein